MERKVEILIVDDSRENADALKAALNDPSYDVVVANEVDEALRAVLKNNLALIIMDVQLKETTGFELARMIKSRPKSSGIPVIFVSASAKDRSTYEQAYASGGADFMEKPLDPAFIRTKVSFFVDSFWKSKKIRLQEELLESDRKKLHEADLERAQRAEQKRFQDLVEGVEHGFVWSADPKTLTFSYISPRAELLLGYPLERWRNESGFWMAHVHPDDRNVVAQAFKSAQLGKDTGIEHRFITADGDTLWLHTGVRLARKGSGVGVELRGLSIDMTYQKQIEQGLSHALEARDEFLSIASHELRTPLTPLLLQLQSLERSIASGSEVDRDRLTKTVQVWRRQVDRLARLIDELLDVSRISAGKLTIDREEVDLRALLEEVLEKYRGELARAGCEVHFAAHGNTLGRWDKSKIEQVFTNLLTNAIKYAPGKPIEIEIDGAADPISFSIRDHGMGISEESQGRIFDRFERAGGAKNIAGLGLGLYICRKIVQAHDGQIKVESRPEDGARFTVTLPRAQKTQGQVA